MAENESVEFFLRFLKERFQTFHESLFAFLQSLANDDRDAKVGAAHNVLSTIDEVPHG